MLFASKFGIGIRRISFLFLGSEADIWLSLTIPSIAFFTTRRVGYSILDYLRLPCLQSYLRSVFWTRSILPSLLFTYMLPVEGGLMMLLTDVTYVFFTDPLFNQLGRLAFLSVREVTDVDSLSLDQKRIFVGYSTGSRNFRMDIISQLTRLETGLATSTGTL